MKLTRLKPRMTFWSAKLNMQIGVGVGVDAMELRKAIVYMRQFMCGGRVVQRNGKGFTKRQRQQCL